MKYLSAKSSEEQMNLNPLQNYINVLNIIVKPLGYVFKYDESNRKMVLFNNQGEKQKMENMSLSIDAFSFKFKMDNNSLIEIKYGDLFDFNNDNIGKIIITDKDGNESVIDFSYRAIPSETFITYVHIRMNGGKYVIYYNRNDDVLVFNRYNDNGEYVGIDMSRKDNTKCSLRFFSGADDHVCRISSSGDDNYHKVSSQMALREKSFNVLYEEYYSDGKQILIDLSHSDYYKHYRNSKLINNENVRALLDQIVGAYKQIFPYEDDENGLLGGYLYKEYINGTPNDRLIANRFLNAVSIPLEAEISKTGPASLKKKKKKGKN